jgi:hypothetical protein
LRVYVKASAPGDLQDLELGWYETLAYIWVLIAAMENMVNQIYKRLQNDILPKYEQFEVTFQYTTSFPYI